MITTYACIDAVFRQVHVVGASPFGVKVLLEDPLRTGSAVTLTHKRLDPIKGRVTWTKDNLARIAFAEPLDEAALRMWFDGVI